MPFKITIAVLLAAVGAVPRSPALAHHCGAYATHSKEGGCLKKIKSKEPGRSAGQATGKRQHAPPRMRMYYDP